jgi:hypothetical protein
MCVLRVFCELVLKVHLFLDNSALHRNSCYVLFPQVQTAITLKPLVVCICSYPETEDL